MKWSMERTSPAEPRAMLQKGEEFGGGTAFESFGDVVGNRQGGAANLVAEVAGLGVEAIAGVGVDLLGEIDGRLPGGQILEAIVFHGSPDFKFEI